MRPKQTSRMFVYASECIFMWPSVGAKTSHAACMILSKGQNKSKATQKINRGRGPSLRIINEPTAAALAYGLDRKACVRQTCIKQSNFPRTTSLNCQQPVAYKWLAYLGARIAYKWGFLISGCRKNNLKIFFGSFVAVQFPLFSVQGVAYKWRLLINGC